MSDADPLKGLMDRTENKMEGLKKEGKQFDVEEIDKVMREHFDAWCQLKIGKRYTRDGEFNDYVESRRPFIDPEDNINPS